MCSDFSGELTYKDKVFKCGLRDTLATDDPEVRKKRYKGIHVFLIVYDIENDASFINATKKWYQEVTSFDEAAPVMFVCNKMDIYYADEGM
jgi:GTPase SAR1 family protein